MSKLPSKLDNVLENEIYKRNERKEVYNSLKRLQVNPSDIFVEFYSKYSGSFGSDNVPYELLDLFENDERNIEDFTYDFRKYHKLPEKYLIISDLSIDACLILDTKSDKVYEVSNDILEQLKKGMVKERWTAFYDFLREYFEV